MKEEKRITREMYQKQKRKKVLRLRPWAFIALLLFFLSILGFSCYQLFHWQKDNQQIKKITETIQKEVVITEKPTQGELVNPPDEDDQNNDYWNYIKVPFLEVDFSTLLQKNADTIAFIHVENTNINYPVVQTNNNDYYLTHAFDKSENDAGWVYMDYRNQINHLSDNTVIYGHGRLDTTVFGSLKNTLTKKWQNNKDNYIIRLSSPTSNMVFQIFSIYTIKAESYYIRTSFRDENEKLTWLHTMKERNETPIDTEVNTNDKIITLSTCKNNHGDRIVVQAKLIKQETRY